MSLPVLFSSVFVFILLSLLFLFLFLFLFALTSITTTASAIPTDRTTIVMDNWAIKRLSNDVYGVTSDFAGNIYFAEHNSNKIGRLSPSTDTITEWQVPTNSSGPIGVAFDSSSGNIYFAEHNSNKIGRLSPDSANAITEWNIGVNPSTIFIDPSGNLYFTSENGIIGRLG